MKPDEYEQAISEWCDNLKAQMLDKYRKGKEEHGDLADGKPLDCIKEKFAEVIDLIIYDLIDKIQSKMSI